MPHLISIVALVALAVTACGQAPTPAASPAVSPPGSTASTVPPAATPVASETPVASASPVAEAPTPVCSDRQPPPWVTSAKSPKDGVPDPAGRIFFAQFSYNTEVLGQVVAPLYAVDPDGSDLAQLLDCDIERPRVSPDGTRLAFSIVMSDGTWQVATSAVDGSDLRILTDGPGYAETPDWSPDGSWLIYSRAAQACLTASWDPCIQKEGNRYTLHRMAADGSDDRPIGDPDTVDWEPRLSPDGREVVFHRWAVSDLLSTLMIRDLATGKERKLTIVDPGGGLELEHPDWSPDGRWIAYNTSGQCGGACERIERVPANDAKAKPVVLYHEARGGAKPAYSPDGASIVFGCRGGSLCRMNADGTDVVVLEENQGLEFNHYDWGVPPQVKQ